MKERGPRGLVARADRGDERVLVVGQDGVSIATRW